jgi:gamma-glutamylputrescine oxidase
VLRSERYFYAINYLRALAIHPLNYALALAAAAERDGARIFENTPALSIDPSGVRKRIVTPGARLRANHVVLCGNIGLKSLMPRLAATMVPLTTYVITTAPLGDRLAEAVRYRGGVSDTDAADNHYRVVGGDRLMLSGRATTWARNPRSYLGALKADIKHTYPQLGDVEIDYAWAGTLGITVHRMPQIGEVGPGVWLASGFGGHGLNTTAMGGNLIARAIVDGDETWRQFTPFELVWAGGVIGRAAGQIRVWVKRLRAAVEERRARARELAHWQARLNAAETAPPDGGADSEHQSGASVPDQIDSGVAAAPRSETLPSETPPEATSADGTPSETVDPAPEPASTEQSVPRASRRRKRTRTGAGRAVEHDAEA